MSTTNSEILVSDDVSLLSRWLSYKRKRFWILLIVLLYTLFGFFLLPALINKWVTDWVQDELGREASFNKVQFNPYVLSLRTTGFEVKDRDGVKLLGYDEYFINLQLSSLFQWAWIFREVRVDGLFFHIERFAPDDTRLARLLADAANRAQTVTEPNQPDSTEMPRLLIHDLSVNQASLVFRDHVPDPMVELEIGPANVSIQELNTLPDRYGQQSVTIKLPDDATLRWEGNISLAPLESEGELALENSHLDQVISYLQAFLPLDSIAATFSMNTHYRINTLDEGGLDFELDELELELSDISITGLEPSTELLSLSEISLQGGSLEYPEKSLSFSMLRLNKPQVNTWFDQNGKPNILELLPKPEDSERTRPEQDSLASAWKLTVDDFLLDGGDIIFADRSISPPGELDISGLQLAVKNLSNAPDFSMPVSLEGVLDAGGDFRFVGEIVAFPEFRLNGQASLSDVPLALAQPYVQQKFNLLIEDGTFSSQTDIEIKAAETLKLAGNLIAFNLNVRDTREELKLLAWEKLDIDRFELDIPAISLQLSMVQFEKPYGRFKINQDRSSNLAGLSRQSQTEEGHQTPGTPAWSVVIGATGVRNGSLDFSDLSLPLPFDAHVTDMDGSVSTIDSVSSEPANIRLEGQVNEFGLARIDGAMNVFNPIGHTNVTVEFRNLLMSNFSPYTAQFAGRKIEAGKLNLDLGYQIDQGRLQGSNKIVLGDLVLGAEVESPDAVELPLSLAVALLTDANGVIDIDLPVEGNVNDPKFQMSGVVMKAITGLITKLVTAPFRLLGSLIGIDSEELGQFQFLAGRSDLTPPELEKIVQLQQALQQRPELSIEISGAFNAGVDRPKLQYYRLRDSVMERLGMEVVDQEDEFEMLDEAIRSVLEALFTEQFPESDLETLKAAHMKPAADDLDGRAELDALAYSADLRDRLLVAQQISTEDLVNLANERAQVIRSAFLSTGEFGDKRVQVSQATATESADGEWVVTELKVAGYSP